jgi:hypothetical protein
MLVYGVPRDIGPITKTTCSNLKLINGLGRWSQWIAQAIASCLDTGSEVIESYLSEWRILECFIEMKPLVLWVDWPEYGNFNKMTPIFSVLKIRYGKSCGALCNHSTLPFY